MNKSAATNAPKLTLVDVAKEQSNKVDSTATKSDMTDSEQPKKLTLMDVAKENDGPKTTATVSLASIAQEINVDERQSMDAAITKAATKVKQEQHQQRADALKETVAQIKMEDARAAEVLQVKVEKGSLAEDTTPPKEVKTNASRLVASTKEAEDDGGYSSFEDEEDSKSIKKKPKSTGKRSKEADNQSEEASAPPPRTTASDTPESKEYMRAVYRGDIRRVADLLDDGELDINTADQHGWSGLHWAASQGHSKLLMVLIKRNAEVNAVEHINGWSPLQVAVIRQQVACVKALLWSGADTKPRDVYGDSLSDCIRAFKNRKTRERMLQLLEESRAGP
ncbi:hypothetical protein Poli38472_009200 [Pythium oligandrum]|uniref:ANK_REP_REGION domain-containing protein n=1 Tax=Pythium oligandrum TaxID=41045 RepID=A0A8K1CMI1_PYTOL|nr:hypothetical protein Poli38472_009200 [Pythium oligandrum]|eukprot:TMW65033.1 hypothetical protein Poli38472_009200 [Pythium oligandrum]